LTHDETRTCPKFGLGQTVATPGAMDAIREAGQCPLRFLARHASGDWGDVCPEDKKMNDESLLDGSRVLSAFTLKNGTRIWVISEAVSDDGQRAATTILLPCEY
jgi:hypothetical protein